MISTRSAQRIEALRIYKNRILNWNRTTPSYLSGDGFAKLCDISVFPPKFRSKAPNVQEISNAHSIFCPSDRLEDFLNTYRDKICAKVFVLGNSDRDFYKAIIFPESVKRVYLQNSHISDNFFKTLPIGAENIRWGKNGFTKLFDESLAQTKKKNAILVGPFSPTHSERKELEPWKLISHQELHFSDAFLDPSRLAKLASQFKYVACPRGNGTDTHRFWETLYRGSIPVVKESKWSNSIKEMGLPVLELRDWDFEEFLEESKNYKYETLNPKNYSVLWLSNWRSEFKIQS